MGLHEMCLWLGNRRMFRRAENTVCAGTHTHITRHTKTGNTITKYRKPKRCLRFYWVTACKVNLVKLQVVYHRIKKKLWPILLQPINNKLLHSFVCSFPLFHAFVRRTIVSNSNRIKNCLLQFASKSKKNFKWNRLIWCQHCERNSPRRSPKQRRIKYEYKKWVWPLPCSTK